MEGLENDDKVVQNNDELELPLAIQSLLKDDSMSDVELECNDGVRIQAHRLILAMRSAVFKSLLCGPFSEATNSVVKIEYSGKVIEYLVEYCYTDKFSPSTSPSDDDKNMIDVLVELVSASDYYGFPRLGRKVKRSIAEIVSAKPSVAWQVLAALPNQELNGQLGKAAYDVAQQKCRVDTIPPTISANVLEMVVSDGSILGKEIDYFRMIVNWIESPGNSGGINDDVGPSEPKRAKTVQSRDDKISIARSLVEKYIKLDRIKPSDFEKVVEPSGLVSKDIILATYKNLSRILEEKKGGMIDFWRGVGWESNGGTIYENTKSGVCTELFRCVPLAAPGIYKWSVKLLGDLMYLDFDTGVIATNSDVDQNKWLGAQTHGWAYDCDGVTYCNGRNKSTVLAYGGKTNRKIITFTLDLTNSGTLTAHFDDVENPIPLFKNLLMDGETKLANRTFVPAVSFDEPCKFEFLGFH